MWSKGKRKIFLIGGVPTTGKSTVAELVAKRVNLPWISTDQIRDVMRAVANRKDHPNLFTSEGYNAERFLNEFSAEKIVDIEFEQGGAVWLGIKKFIEDDFTWSKGFVMEGVSLIPELIAELNIAGEIRAVFLVDDDADRIREVIFNRGLFDDAENYPDYVKEKEIAWVKLFSNKIKKEAQKYNYPVIEVEKKENNLTKVLRALKLNN
jgi:2-phosphoglycerate kinase